MAEYTEEEKKELEALRKQADLLGIVYSGNTGLDTLRKKVQEVNGTIEERKSNESEYDKVYKEKMRLIRCQVQCLDPMYKNAGGMFFTIGNSVLGSHKYFVYFNRPIHITKWLYDHIKSRTYIDRSERGTRGNDGLTHSKTVNTVMPAYNITDLQPLTKEELKKLADEQKATGRLENKD